MTDEPPKKLSFSEMRRKLAEERGRTLPEQTEEKRHLRAVPEVDADLVPDVLGEQTEEDLEIDGIIASLDILDAYRKWIGKEVNESTTGKTEGIQVSCPLPGHRDKHPSAWLNTDNRTWFCGGCQEGGDIYDIAAIKFGYARPDYKDGKTFHELRKDMAEAYGYRFKKVAGTEVIWREEAPSESNPTTPVENVRQAGTGGDPGQEKAKASPEPAPNQPAQEDPTGTVSYLESGVEDEAEPDLSYPVLDWKAITPEGTFLYEYCKATSNDDSPEEYHYWHGLLGLAHAVGRKVYLDDTRPVYGNLLVCLLGGTGYGKSRSRYWLDMVLEAAAPFKDNGLDTSGCKMVPVPASGEMLIKHFQHMASDPSLPANTGVLTPVNGIVDFDEFSSLLARANRQGNILKPIIMGMSDAKNKVSTSSMTSGTIEAYKPFCSITASTQPKAVRTLLSKTDTGSGFLNRWIFVGGPRKKREIIGGKRSAIRVELADAIRELKAVRAWGAAERSIEFTDDGYMEIERFFRTVVHPTQLKDDSDLLPRLDLTMKRLVLLFCINERKLEADADLVKRVEPLLEYLIACYGILNAEIGISQMTEITTEILRHIKNVEEKTGRGASARDLARLLHRKNYSPDLIDRALKTMVALDWIDIDKQKGVGRPTLRYTAVNS